MRAIYRTCTDVYLPPSRLNLFMRLLWQIIRDGIRIFGGLSVRPLVFCWRSCNKTKHTMTIVVTFSFSVREARRAPIIALCVKRGLYLWKQEKKAPCDSIKPFVISSKRLNSSHPLNIYHHHHAPMMSFLICWYMWNGWNRGYFRFRWSKPMEKMGQKSNHASDDPNLWFQRHIVLSSKDVSPPLSGSRASWKNSLGHIVFLGFWFLHCCDRERITGQWSLWRPWKKRQGSLIFIIIMFHFTGRHIKSSYFEHLYGP